MNADARFEKEKVLEDFCEENGFKHSTSCYMEQVGNEARDEFWVCRPGCSVVIAKQILFFRNLLKGSP